MVRGVNIAPEELEAFIKMFVEMHSGAPPKTPGSNVEYDQSGAQYGSSGNNAEKEGIDIEE
jgi:hypothetical protein